MNKVLEDLQNNKEYLAGLNEALFPDYAEVCGLMGNVGYSKGDYVLFQQLISKNPSDERLVQTIKNDVKGLFFFEFFCLPLARVLKYTIMNNLPLLAKYKFPPKYNLYEPESICGVLRQLTKKGREQIINSYDIDYVYSEKLRQAIMEPNVEIMRELLESKEVDLMWLQQMLDVVKYEDDLLNIIIDNNNDFSKEEIDNINNDYVKSIMLVDVPDVNEILRIKTTEKASVTEVCVLYLKNYWVCCDLLDEKTRTIIDAYINKPCFEEVVSKCRAEFEEDERRRKNADSETNDDSDNNLEVVNNSERQPQSFEVEDDYKPFTFSPTDKPTNLYPESEYAFDGSVGLASFAINNKERFERFIALTVNTFHYLHGKNQAKAFVRTITGIKCDGGVTKPKLQSNDAVYAVLYMAQRGILTGKINQALQKFDFEYGVKNDGKGSWHATYAKKTNNQFKRLVFETFCDYEGFKNDKNIDF